jgi:hypothetical protein
MNSEFGKNENDLVFSSVAGHRGNNHYDSTIVSHNPKFIRIGGSNL